MQMSQVYTAFSLLAQVSITRSGIATQRHPERVPINALTSEVDFGAGTFSVRLIRSYAGVANSLCRWLEQRTMRKSKV
jgi:hypothetical protein